MKTSRQYSFCVKMTDAEGKIHRNADATILEKNPKIDWRLLEECERLAASWSGARLKKKGADYNIAHPLARKDMPTDAFHRGQSVRKTGC